MTASKGGRGSRAPKGSGGKGHRALEGRKDTIPASQRHWYGKKQADRAAKRDAKFGDAPAPRAVAARRGRGEREMVVGRNPVVEALRARVPADALLLGVSVDADDRVKEAVRIAGDLGVPVQEAGRAELDRRTEGAPHQGLALVVPPFPYVHPGELLESAMAAEAPALVVALDGITDPHNLGAVARSAAAFGAHGLLIPERRAAGVTAAAWKTSAGTLARLPVARAVNLTRTLEDYRRAGLFVVGLDGTAEADIDAVDLLTGPVVVVVGSEGRGLSRLVRERCDLVARIPMGPAAESLNASVASGVALYEVSRSRSRSA
ncbi:23S rRNA (guanosine(2251)-2'-O)-methyltransferase RlmB [Allonocardiopsis opalescens]|uniref:23S rRNA (Guanosine2251-2'-O)-methyltransferase n=1 Tax=Allonocardiopsis opalescens TaxID=1144618 RepID=A0A2T0QA82_9ACTN|nr:23S rRNA (guanosine(2251)-2'-O)-methyltransferase RlmB [Allonocardiopsis opalescens]PRY00722.1 23S rRNA (guanosine2251-2'-O)-methyltransferase [Allonocardiopsis opalescens]